MLCGTTGKGNGQGWKVALVGIIVLQLVAVTAAVAVAVAPKGSIGIMFCKPESRCHVIQRRSPAEMQAS